MQQSIDAKINYTIVFEKQIVIQCLLYKYYTNYLQTEESTFEIFFK